MKEFFGIASFVLGFGVTFPYALDIIKGRAIPARSTRILFFILLVATLTVQSREFTSWTLAYTVAEALSQAILVVMAIKYGIGGLKRLDIISYAVFALAITGYIVTGQTIVGLVLLCITDLVAFIPTIVKNWNDPTTDTPLFFAVGAFAALLSALAASDLSDVNQTVVPLYLVAINVVALIPLLLPRNAKKM